MPVPVVLPRRRIALRGLPARRGRVFAPRMPQGATGQPLRVRTSRRPVLHQLSRRRGAFFSVPASTRPGGALMSASGTLAAGGTAAQAGLVVMSASGTLRAWASAGPDLEALWQVSQAAAQAASAAEANWRMVRGSYDEAIYWYQRHYAADQAAIIARRRYEAARAVSLGQPVPPVIPGVG